jgi:hypothetical protein
MPLATYAFRTTPKIYVKTATDGRTGIAAPFINRPFVKFRDDLVMNLTIYAIYLY